MGFGDIAKDVCGNTLILVGCICNYKQHTFLDLYTCIRVIDKQFLAGICHKVDMNVL